MKVGYSRILEISVDANSQKDAEKLLKESLLKIRHLASAFDFSLDTSVGFKSSDNNLFRYTYIFSIEVETITDYGSILRHADIIRTFAHFNSFEVGKEAIHPLDDVSDPD